MTNLVLGVNVGDADIPYGETGSEYIILDLVNDYLIWTEGDDIVKDGYISEPTPTELINASVIIDPSVAVTVPLCLLMDYSGIGVNSLREVKGMGVNKRYPFLFSFDGATATEPQLEAWDDDTMLTIIKNVLGVDDPADSMVKAVCTTIALPGNDWLGTAIAGSEITRMVGLNNGYALTGAQDCYANIKIVIPANYPTPAIEAFSLVVRYTWL